AHFLLAMEDIQALDAIIEEIKMDPQITDLLIKKLENEKYYIRESAAKALGKIKDPRAIEPLIGRLYDSGDYTPGGTNLIYSDGDFNHIDCVIGEETYDGHYDGGDYVRIAAANAIENISEALGKIGDTQAVDLLIQALKDENPDIQKTAAGALGELKAINAVDPLKQAFRDKEEDINVRMCYAEALGKIGDAKFFDQMIQDLNDVDSHIKYMAANALGKSKSIQAVDSLIHALADKDPLVRLASAIALGEIGDAKAVNPLSQTLKDEDLRVRKGAAEAWKKLESVIK
ncbi:MAG: HEAT repeat domain-containing protein, partial [Methanothrix sp.]